MFIAYLGLLPIHTKGTYIKYTLIMFKILPHYCVTFKEATPARTTPFNSKSLSPNQEVFVPLYIYIYTTLLPFTRKC